MSEPMNFRSAFNGFNREDVVHYIEYLKSNHQNQLRQLQADLAAAQREELMVGEQDTAITDLQEQFTQQEAILTALNAEKDELIAKCSRLEAELAARSAENAALADKAARLEAQLSTANAKPHMSTYMEEELAAYRRAERVERLANERANAVYRKLRVALQETTTQADHAVTNLDNIASQVNAQLRTLRHSLSDSKTYLEQSICSLDDICPQQIDK